MTKHKHGVRKHAVLGASALDHLKSALGACVCWILGVGLH